MNDVARLAVVRCDAATFLARGAAHLLAREAEHNLALSIARRVADTGAPLDAYFALVVEAPSAGVAPQAAFVDAPWAARDAGVGGAQAARGAFVDAPREAGGAAVDQQGRGAGVVAAQATRDAVVDAAQEARAAAVDAAPAARSAVVDVAPGRAGSIEGATGVDPARVVGAAFRTPPFKLALGPMPPAAVYALVDDAARMWSSLPAVIGPVDEAGRFARAWAARTGVAARPDARQRVHQVDVVTPQERPPPGRARSATDDDVDLVVSWVTAFAAETGAQMDEARAAIARWRHGDGLLVWDDGGPTSMAARVGDTPNGARIGAVYTPPAARGRGYAQAVTTALTERVLASGKRSCFLYTDLANPTSNALYARIGYRPVADVVVWELT